MSTTRWLDRPLMGTLCRRWVSTQATVLVRTSVARRRSSWSLSCAPGRPYSKMPLLSTWQRSDDDGHIRTTISSSVSVNTCMYAAKTPCTVCSVVKVGLKRWGNYFPSPSSFLHFFGSKAHKIQLQDVGNAVSSLSGFWGKAPIQNLQGEVRTLSPTPIDTYVYYIN